MTISELYQTAKNLPLLPGVYLMHNSEGAVIYVGKAKKLRNRVSQYFASQTRHNRKTQQMVRNVESFEVIIARSEFEALVLENSLIKQYSPKYNILLKDDKGYPYIRIDLREEYPSFSLSGRIEDDGASYFGPFGGRSVSSEIINTIRKALKLPGCSKQFPKDLRKDRPCLNYRMGICSGWCRGTPEREEHQKRVDQAVMILQGRHRDLLASLKQEMENAAEQLDFETAAVLRDRYTSVSLLGVQQLVSTGRFSDTDFIGYCIQPTKACFLVLHYNEGKLSDKDFEILDSFEPEEIPNLILQYYLTGACPKEIIIPEELGCSDDIERFLSDHWSKKVSVKWPQRGDYKKLSLLANENAFQELNRVRTKADRSRDGLIELERLLGDVELRRIEAYDISHTSGTDITGSMIVSEDGILVKKDYRLFKINGFDNQDDLHCMQEVLLRRFSRYQNGDSGFDVLPDLLLMDGGELQAAIAEQVLSSFSLHIPVLGMVKDDRHRTNALITSSGEMIDIRSSQKVFSLIGEMQEEVHRFAIGYHKKLRSKRMSGSELNQIPGIGEKRRQLLLNHFHSVKQVKAASLEELKLIVPSAAAESVYSYYHTKESTINESD